MDDWTHSCHDPMFAKAGDGYELIGHVGNSNACCECALKLGKLPSRDVPTFMLPCNTFSAELSAFKVQLEALDAEVNPKILLNTFDALESKALRTIVKNNLIAIGVLIPLAFLDEKDLPENAFGATYYKNQGIMWSGWIRSPNPCLICHYNKWKRYCMWVVGKQLTILAGVKSFGRWFDSAMVFPSGGSFTPFRGMFRDLLWVEFYIGEFDQPTNAKLLENEFKTGVRATKNDEGIVEGDEIKRMSGRDPVHGGRGGRHGTAHRGVHENQARENTAESRASFLTREFLRAKPDEFHGGPEPKKADEWLEQSVKTFEMLHIEDSELRICPRVGGNERALLH
ncbi:hypothetical protein HYC85_019632 [Camellia sinensis]|uniref:Uncharacterized protein n=1 Tax=Camellia sinensis TaxID=4442 RepID=A0A7J7GMQ3_CAMSI|nr:hypothetical protein HYC85_019632 [Camellia sinensis]